jgi:ribosomal protein S18 acetylase RimI-like enzyme
MAHSYLVLTVRVATPNDQAAIAAIHEAIWDGSIVVGHGTVFDLRTLATLVAVDEADRVVGALAYQIGENDLELVSIAAGAPGTGAGTALLAHAADLARAHGLYRIWLVTTNDNLDALRFYQRRGMRIVAVEPDAVDRSRELKPTIPQVGGYGIAIRDELTLELRLDQPPA